MYAVIEAFKTYPVDPDHYPKTRRWGEPRLRFVAETMDEVRAWWDERCAKTPLHDQLSGYDYVAVIGPKGITNLMGERLCPLPDEGWVQVRMGVFGPPLTD